MNDIIKRQKSFYYGMQALFTRTAVCSPVESLSVHDNSICHHSGTVLILSSMMASGVHYSDVWESATTLNLGFSQSFYKDNVSNKFPHRYRSSEKVNLIQVMDTEDYILSLTSKKRKEMRGLLSQATLPIRVEKLSENHLLDLLDIATQERKEKDYVLPISQYFVDYSTSQSGIYDLLWASVNGYEVLKLVYNEASTLCFVYGSALICVMDIDKTEDYSAKKITACNFVYAQQLPDVRYLDIDNDDSTFNNKTMYKKLFYNREGFIDYWFNTEFAKESFISEIHDKPQLYVLPALEAIEYFISKYKEYTGKNWCLPLDFYKNYLNEGYDTKVLDSNRLVFVYADDRCKDVVCLSYDLCAYEVLGDLQPLFWTQHKLSYGNEAKAIELAMLHVANTSPFVNCDCEVSSFINTDDIRDDIDIWNHEYNEDIYTPGYEYTKSRKEYLRRAEKKLTESVDFSIKEYHEDLSDILDNCNSWYKEKYPEDDGKFSVNQTLYLKNILPFVKYKAFIMVNETSNEILGLAVYYYKGNELNLMYVATNPKYNNTASVLVANTLKMLNEKVVLNTVLSIYDITNPVRVYLKQCSNSKGKLLNFSQAVYKPFSKEDVENE